MKIKSVSYGRAISANYQGKRSEVTIDLEPGDTFQHALATAKYLVDIALGETVSEDPRKIGALLNRVKNLD